MLYSDLKSERKVLSAATFSENACIEVITQLDSEDFSDQLHRDLFNLIMAIYTGGVFPNYTLLLKEAEKLGFLNSTKKFEDINAVFSDWQYTDWEYRADNIQYWIDEVLSSSKARACFSVLSKYQAMLADKGKQDIDDTLAGTINDLSQIDIGRTKDELEEGKQIGAILKKLIDAKVSRFQELRLSGEVILEGLPTGFSKLDNLTLGFKAGDLIILAAQTGHGKTAFALQTAKNITIDQDKTLLYINTEMSREIIYQRLCGVISGVPYYNIRMGSINPNDEHIRVHNAIAKIRKSGFIHSYSPHLTPIRCVTLGKKAKIQKKTDMMIIDYVGRMDKLDPKLQEWQVLEQVAKSMKLLAQELRIPIMVLAQLNEDGSLQGAKRIKNECDLLLKLLPLSKAEKEEKYDKSYENANYRLFVEKNRDGDTGKNIALHYEKPIQRINSAKPKKDQWSDMARDIEGDVL